MQLHLFSTDPNANLHKSAAPAPVAPPPTVTKPRKPRRQRQLHELSTDQLIDRAVRAYGVLLNFNAKPEQSSKGYSEAQDRFNEVFALLLPKFSPAQIIAFCMEDVEGRLK